MQLVTRSARKKRAHHCLPSFVAATAAAIGGPINHSGHAIAAPNPGIAEASSSAYAQATSSSQQTVAERCGSNYPYISELERGLKVPTLTMILRLAGAFECKVRDLMRVFDAAPQDSFLG